MAQIGTGKSGGAARKGTLLTIDRRRGASGLARVVSRNAVLSTPLCFSSRPRSRGPAALLIALLACAAPGRGSRAVGEADWAPGPDTVLVLAADPGECFACNRRLAGWIRRTQSARPSLGLVLTRAPTEQERTVIALHRLRSLGVYHVDPVVAASGSNGIVLAFVDGALVGAASVDSGAADSLLARYLRPAIR